MKSVLKKIRKNDKIKAEIIDEIHEKTEDKKIDEYIGEQLYISEHNELKFRLTAQN